MKAGFLEEAENSEVVGFCINWSGLRGILGYFLNEEDAFPLRSSTSKMLPVRPTFGLPWWRFLPMPSKKSTMDPDTPTLLRSEDASRPGTRLVARPQAHSSTSRLSGVRIGTADPTMSISGIEWDDVPVGAAD